MVHTIYIVISLGITIKVCFLPLQDIGHYIGFDYEHNHKIALHY